MTWAYAKTFYPHSKVTLYLNKLASGIYLGIYKNKKEESSRIIRFWKTELPLVIRKHHRILFYSFLIFCFLFSWPRFSAANDQDFVRGVLGNGYMEMTEQNIAKGDPFGVYKEPGSSFDVFLDCCSQCAGLVHDFCWRHPGRPVNDLAACSTMASCWALFNIIFFPKAWVEICAGDLDTWHTGNFLHYYFRGSRSGAGKSLIFPGTLQKTSVSETGSQGRIQNDDRAGACFCYGRIPGGFCNTLFSNAGLA